MFINELKRIIIKAACAREVLIRFFIVRLYCCLRTIYKKLSSKINKKSFYPAIKTDEWLNKRINKIQKYFSPAPG
jgi:hypothetical protein